MRVAVLLLVGAAVACGGKRSAEDPGEKPSAEPTASLPTSVRVAAAARRTLAVYVTGPGKTAALLQQKVRAPFAGTLTELRVIDGDRVRRGQVVGAIVARESEAALAGAREMLRSASTPAERADAERAVTIAEKNLVRRPLTATCDGAVLSHAANAGDRVAEDQEILTIDDASSIAFLADVPQADLARVRPGQTAMVETAGAAPVTGIVHAILPSANPADATASVRIDVPAPARQLALGIFGTASIRVDQHQDATVVPDAAVLKDDVTGTARVAIVRENRAHWIDVRTGLKQGGVTEIVQPPLAPGTTVIVSGLVGLPEGKTVAPQS